jgi:hypothetical protein
MKHSSTLYVGLDVHKESIAIAYVSDAKDAEMLYLGSIGTRQCDIGKIIRRLHSKSAQLVFVYEAGLCGYWLYRYLLGGGPLAHPEEARRQGQDQPARCRAARPPDALGGPHPGLRPRDRGRGHPGSLSRAREDAIGDLKAAKYQLKAFLLRQDIRYEGKASWGRLAEVVCPTPAQQIVFQEYVRAVNEPHERVERIETELQEKAKGWRFYPVVEALQLCRAWLARTSPMVPNATSENHSGISPRALGPPPSPWPCRPPWSVAPGRGRAGRKSGSSSSRDADISGEIHPRILIDLDLRQGVAHLHLPERGTAAVERRDHSAARVSDGEALEEGLGLGGPDLLRPSGVPGAHQL